MMIGRFVTHALASGLTLYMLLIMVRWCAPYMELDLVSRRLRWIKLATDPLINLMHRFLPPMGPFDWAPLASVVAVWMVRLVLFQY